MSCNNVIVIGLAVDSRRKHPYTIMITHGKMAGLAGSEIASVLQNTEYLSVVAKLVKMGIRKHYFKRERDSRTVYNPIRYE